MDPESNRQDVGESSPFSDWSDEVMQEIGEAISDCKEDINENTYDILYINAVIQEQKDYQEVLQMQEQFLCGYYQHPQEEKGIHEENNIEMAEGNYNQDDGEMHGDANDSDSLENIPLSEYVKKLKSTKRESNVSSDEFDDSDRDVNYTIGKDDYNSSDSNLSSLESSDNDSECNSEHVKGVGVKRTLFDGKKQKYARHPKKIRKGNTGKPTKQNKESNVEIAKKKSMMEERVRQIVNKYHIKRLDNLLSSNGFKRIKIKEDGDCFFSAVNCQLDEETTVSDIRSKLCDHLLDNQETYINFLHVRDGGNKDDEYKNQIQLLRNNGRWNEKLSDCLPLAVANTFQQNVKIFSSRLTNPLYDIQQTIGSNNGGYICLAYIAISGREHYDGIKKVNRPRQFGQITSTLGKSSNTSEKTFKTPRKRPSVYNVTPHKDAIYNSPKRKELRRKRKSEPALWKRNVRIRNRAAGLEYISQKKKLVPAKKMDDTGCSKCKFKCHDKMTHEQRLSIHNLYWQMQDYNRQRDFICQNVKASHPERTKGHKKVTYSYFLPLENSQIRVCRTFFCKTVSVGKKTIHTAMRNKISGVFTGTDKRGRHTSANKTPTESINYVRQHIDSFPKMESHYVRKRTKRQFLPRDLNIKRMWLLYKEFCIEKNLKPVSEKKYRDVFCEEFNYSFFKPKKDQCSICEVYDMKKKRSELNENDEEEYKSHQERKTNSRKEKEKDKERTKTDKSFHCATFDLQAVLSTPCSLVGELYYKRKLSVYNLSFYSLGDKNGTCYIWDETQGGRGSCEIATCLSLYTNSVTANGAVKELTFYSDTCGGQNRNMFVTAGLLNVVNQAGTLEKVSMKFFERGHSQMESDSIHAAIEETKKNTPIHVPSQWHTLISCARKSKPYLVVPIKFSDIHNYKDLVKKVCPNMKVTTTGNRVNWLRIKWIQVRRSNPTSIYVNEGYEENQFQEIRVQSSTRSKGRFQKWPEILKPVYNSKLSISAAKKADLLSLCTSGIITSDHHEFYQNLPTGKNVRDRLPVPDCQESDMETDSETE